MKYFLRQKGKDIAERYTTDINFKNEARQHIIFWQIFCYIYCYDRLRKKNWLMWPDIKLQFKNTLSSRRLMYMFISI